MESAASLSRDCSMSSARDDPPILRMMPEISTYIFSWVENANERISFPDTPWIISQVCRRWRDIALSCPELWSHVCVHKPRTFNFSGRVHQLETSLIRSQSYPLYVWYADDGDPNAHLWDVLLDHCDHWHTLELFLSAPDFARRLPKPQRHSLPLLERLQILQHLYKTDTMFELNESVLDAFDTATRLHDICLVGFQFPSSINLHWSQLTRIDLVCGSPRDGINILRKTPNLEWLSVNDSPYNFSLRDAPIIHTSLRNLSTPPVALRHFTLPALKALFTETSARSTPSPTPIVHEFIVRSQCTLRDLHLKGIDMDQSLINLLKDTPTLEYLSLDFGSSTPGAFEVLSEAFTYPEADKPSSDVLLPHLARLYLSVGSDLPMNDKFITMVQSRWYVDQTRGARLQKLFCTFADDTSSDGIKLLRQMIEEGLKLYVCMGGDVSVSSTPGRSEVLSL
ncbi:hypothetical protein ARMSODRAFT_1088279 [Armillaria solidipes]|uniref:Uncharacterized protein n=1 Tax=Armillaria solidipes TaxID=1076256 RepID=A0A2H3BA76_9AGAR|nr:hypothetical protein ARMSODRAFT_1088279 [Armillaria solidipes]